MADVNLALQEINDFLHCPTPQAWLEVASQPQNLPLLLIDHANCEKKAASSAMNLIYRYTEKPDVLLKMSKLAREELRHFEQVLAIMKKRGIHYEVIGAARYAAGMHQHIRTHEPARLVDSLIIGAIIEARSCERFASLAPYLDEDLKQFYESLLKSESRHYKDYLSLARKYSEEAIGPRCEFFLEIEKGLIESEDNEFRFHSGIVDITA